ncbi:MAG: secretin N-terminal domain-containing protein [Thiobacillaceae bacterium]
MKIHIAGVPGSRIKDRFAKLVAVLGCAAVTACLPPQAIRPSQGHIPREPSPSKAEAPPPAPVKAAPYVPPPNAAAATPRYTVVVNDVPVKDLLFSIARDTQHNIDIHPGITGRISLNAVNEPLNAILDRIAKEADLRYEVVGHTISIMPDTPYLKIYRVNYVNLTRNTASTIGVASQIASTSTNINAVSGNSASSGNNSNTDVKTTTNNDFWGVLKDNIVNILYATKVEQKKAEERAAIADGNRLQLEIKDSDKAQTSLAKDQELLHTLSRTAAPQPGDSEREVIVNPVAGIVSVFANERQQQLIQEYIDKVSRSSQRQVMIDATIVEVTLNDQYHAGINWQSLASNLSTGWTINTMGAGIGGANLANQLQPFAAIGYTNTGRNISSTINLLESFGKTKVLSSPKLMTLNNQTALLKVVNNLVYFSIDVSPGTLSSTGSQLTPTLYTTAAHTIPVGVVMSVTPQIAENGQITLTVRPTITRKVGEAADPNPELAQANITSNVPIIQVREMESLLQVRSGQTVILGGLIQDDSDNARDGLPVLSRPEGIGAIFGQHERTNSQTELVIFLRPTVVADGAMADDDLQPFEHLLPTGTSTTP